ncbi:MAG TPA: hypothetical protein VG276_05015 [Actinomycetes bacterium]|jgi:hypothetical protein|nr:hypothetical protein [Actinomycetes bacterium]
MVTRAACLLAPGGVNTAGAVVTGLVVLGGLLAIVALLLIDQQDERAHQRRMARAKAMRQHD